MKIIKSYREMRGFSLSMRSDGKTVGLVPTMGALHEGHLSLLKIARERCDYVVMSIFVNPAQFGPAEDFEKYPRRFDEDCQLAESVGCDCVFAPAAGEMYPSNYSTYVDVGNVTEGLCGAKRPGHFRGVATVVLKLFNIVTPDIAVFGAKDAQQVIVIKRMVEDLNLPVEIITAPIIRESDGLAMSSRNAYLSTNERAEAVLIYRALCEAKKLCGNNGDHAGATALGRPLSSQIIKDRIMSILGDGRLIKPEYIEIVDVITVKPIDKIDRPVLIAIACHTAETGTRLIDNITI